MPHNERSGLYLKEAAGPGTAPGDLFEVASREIDPPPRHRRCLGHLLIPRAGVRFPTVGDGSPIAGDG